MIEVTFVFVRLVVVIVVDVALNTSLWHRYHRYHHYPRAQDIGIKGNHIAGIGKAAA